MKNDLGERPKGRMLLVVVITIVFVRFLLSSLPSYRIDMAGYRAWSLYLADNGFKGFYKTYHVVYAPAYMYLLWITGMFARLFSLGEASHIFLIKIWAVLSDIIGGYLIYRIANSHKKGTAGLILGTIYALNPGVFFNSSIWGQFDSIPATILLLSIYLIGLDKKVTGFIIFCTAVLTKPQSGLLAPVVLFMFFRGFNFRKAADRLTLLYSFIGGFCVYVFAVVPFYFPTPLYNKTGAFVDVFYWMFHLYSKSLGDYPFATANAFNIWTLFGGQLVNDKNIFIGISYSTWGLVLTLLTIVFSLLLLSKRKDSPTASYFCSYLVMSGSFLFATRMHERYLLPALIFVTMCVVFDRKLAIPGALLSVCVLANHWYIYNKAINDIYWINNYDTVGVIFAALTLAVFIYSVYYGAALISRDAISSVTKSRPISRGKAGVGL